MNTIWSFKKRLVAWLALGAIVIAAVVGGFAIFHGTTPKTVEMEASVQAPAIEILHSAVAEESKQETITVEPYDATARILDGTYAYMGPGEEYEKIMIFSDKPFKVVGKYNEWVVIELSDNVYAFVLAEQAKVEQSTPEPTATPTPKPTATPTPKPTAVPTATPTPKPTATPTPKPTATPMPKPTATPTVAPTNTPDTQDFGRWVVMDPERTAQYKGVAGEIYNGARVGTIKDTPVYKSTDLKGEPLAVIPMNAMLWVLETRGNLLSLRYTLKGTDIVVYAKNDTMVLVEKK